MGFVWPINLWWMAVLALLPPLYLWLLRRRRVALRLPSLQLLRRAGPAPGWRRHLPPALVWLALALLVVALARPTARVTLPWARTTVLLAMDVSLSMRVEDVKPSRMAAAQEAAKLFLAELPRHMEVGLITFAGSAQVAQAPTRDREAVAAAIDAIQMQVGTAIGSGIAVCLAELFPEQNIDLGALTYGTAPGAVGPGRRRPAGEALPPPVAAPVAPGSFDAAAIVLLSDGRRTTGIDTLAAAQMAAERGVRIDVIGLGTPDGHLAMGGGMASYLQLDEPTLRAVAKMTGGEYHAAASAEVLRGVYRSLGARVQLRQRETELTGLVAAAAAALLVLGAGLSVAWFGRVL